MKQLPCLSFRLKLLLDGRVVVATTVELDDTFVGPSYMKPLIDKTHEPAMFLALRDDNVNKIHVSVCETLARSTALLLLG